MPTIFGAGLDFLDITDYIFLDDDVETEGADLSGRPPEGLSPDCTGIVLHSSFPSLNPSASPEASCIRCLSVRPESAWIPPHPSALLACLGLSHVP